MSSAFDQNDMSVAWLAHAPPPPPVASSSSSRSRSSSKPRRTSSFDPSSSLQTQSFSVHGQGGYLPPDSFSPEPRPSKPHPIFSSAPSSPAKRHRSKSSSQPAPPAPSAFYNYQHLQQQQQQQHQPQQYSSPVPPSAYSSYSTNSSHNQALSTASSQEYSRSRHDSTPLPVTNNLTSVAYAAQSPTNPSQFVPPNGGVISSNFGHHPPVYPPQTPVADHPHQTWNNQVHHHQQHHHQLPQPSQHYFPPSGHALSSPPPMLQQHSTDPTSYYPTPQQQHVSTFPPVASHFQPPHPPPSASSTPFPTDPYDSIPLAPQHMQTFPTTTTPNFSPFPTTELSRQSTISSVSSSGRRPLPQPNRNNSSNPSLPGSTTLSHRTSIRRDLPRLPTGSTAVSASALSKITLADSAIHHHRQTPPLSGLNRTESVRMAAEALMARGVPQRRPLRSALANSRMTATSTTNDENAMTTSQSDPTSRITLANGNVVSSTLTYTAAVPSAPSPSQSAGPALPGLDRDWNRHANTQQAAYAYHGSDHQVSHQQSYAAPASYQDAVAQVGRSHTHFVVNPNSSVQQLTDSLEKVSMEPQPQADFTSTPSVQLAQVPAVTISLNDQPEVPRRRRGSTASPSKPPSSPNPNFIIPLIHLPDDHVESVQLAPVITVSESVDADSIPGVRVISISVENDDDSRSSSSNRGPCISVSFSGDPAPKSQRATSLPYSRAGQDVGGAASASTIGGAVCYACQKYIAGKVVHALNTNFHPSCFVCAHCMECLEHVAFYEKEGLPYCHFDYHELFSKRCFHCRTPIVDERFITVQDQEFTGGFSNNGEEDEDEGTKQRCYHELHFFCANCGDPFLDPKAAGSTDPGLMMADEDGRVKLGGMDFIVHKGYPYCEKCHIQLHKPKCKKCRNPIIGDLVSALENKYHPECFVCQRCENPFQETNFFVRDGKVYDQDCYKILLRTLV